MVWKERSRMDERVQLSDGRFRWNMAMVTIGHALEGEWIGLEQADDMHHVYFADVRLGFIDDRRPELGLIRPPTKSWARVQR